MRSISCEKENHGLDMNTSMRRRGTSSHVGGVKCAANGPGNAGSTSHTPSHHWTRSLPPLIVGILSSTESSMVTYTRGKFSHPPVLALDGTVNVQIFCEGLVRVLLTQFRDFVSRHVSAFEVVVRFWPIEFVGYEKRQLV